MSDTLTPREAAERCRVSLRTMRRWLAAGELEGATRDDEGRWHIPPAAILGRLPTGAVPEAPPPSSDELAELRAALELERTRRQAAERLADAERARAEAVERALEDVSLALRALSAGTETGAAQPPPEPERRRRRFGPFSW